MIVHVPAAGFATDARSGLLRVAPVTMAAPFGAIRIRSRSLAGYWPQSSCQRSSASSDVVPAGTVSVYWLYSPSRRLPLALGVGSRPPVDDTAASTETVSVLVQSP